MWFRGIHAAVIGCLLGLGWEAAATAQCAPSPVEAQAKFDQLTAWLATSNQGPGWHQYLLSDQLKAQLAAGQQADPVAVAQVLSRYASGIPGLEKRQFVEVRIALRKWLSELPAPAFDQIYPAIETAKSAFVPLTDTDQERAREKLSQAVQRLEARLDTFGQIGTGWKTYLGWDQLKQELAKPAPDLTVLETIYSRFNSGSDGLNRHIFTEVRDALRRYVLVARAIGNEKLAQQYPQVLDLLAKYLRAYGEKPSPRDAAKVSEALRWLQDTRQAPWIVDAIRRHYWRPNFYGEASVAVVAAMLGRSVDETAPVEDCILGTSIHGTGHTTGNVTVELVPSLSYGAVDLLLLASTSSDTIGYNGPVQIFSTGLTQHASRKRLVLSVAGLSDLPAQTNATTATDINSIAANRRIIEQFAWRRATKQQSQAEQIASDHAEQRINARLDQQAAEQMADVNRRYETQFRRPLERYDLFPPVLTFSTTFDAMNVSGIEAQIAELGAPSEPPALSMPADIGARVHESMINSAAERLLGGMIVTEAQLQRDVTDLLGYLPDQLKNPEQDGEPWAITFATRQPISVVFRDGGFSVTISGTSYTKGDADYPGMNVTVSYKLESTDQGPRAVREGDLAIFPPGFDPASGQQLSTREQVIRRMLERRFEQVFPKEIVPKPVTPKDQLAKIGTLMLKEWRSANGWMLLGWQRAPETKAVAVSY